MFDYTYDSETGGILLNDRTPIASKEPRPVYSAELDLLHMDCFWKYERQNDKPYMWAEAANYIYRGQVVARVRGGSLTEAPTVELAMVDSVSGQKEPVLPAGTTLLPVDLDAMVEKNTDMMAIIEQVTVKKIYDYYKRYKDKLDCFHVAFSGGKDSVVLEKLVEKALPHDAFMVIFGDTKMEFPDTYDLVTKMEEHCRDEEIPFYRAASHLDPQDSWRMFGPPSRTLRWCCSVQKAAPQTIKIREVLGKSDFVGADFVGVRAQESLKRSEYEFESYGKKQKGQYSMNPILDWTSAEVWMYIYSRNLLINETYKKGNSRAGCLFCPMGRGKSDFFRHESYPDAVDSLIDIIRDTINDKDIESYINNGGWCARNNGRDLIGNEMRFFEEIKGNRLIITVIKPTTDWKEWIKTLGDLPFDYIVENTAEGYTVSLPASYDKTTIGKRFKQVFRKAAYCLRCGVCEANCRFGCLDLKNGVKITDCRHCLQCHEVDEGCLAYHALELPKNGGHVMKSLNTFADHAPKPEWVSDFFSRGNDFFKVNDLGPMQKSMFGRFLSDAQLAVKKTVTPFYELVKSVGTNSDSAWGLIYTQLVYSNPQIRWYVDNMPIGVTCSRSDLEEQLVAMNISEKDAKSIVKAFKRLTEIQLGTVLHFGKTTGRSVDTLSRTKCRVRDDRVLLYSLYRYAEGCGGYYEFNVSRLTDTTINSNGISPVKLFGLSRDDLETMLGGLSAKYPEFINYTSTHGLDKISLREDKASSEVLELFQK